MSVKIGISPIAWQNDDLPDLTAAYTMEQALKEAREIGYTGVERGQRMPSDTEGLRAYLEGNDIALCGGWCSGGSLVNDFEAEREAVREQVEQFVALNSPCIVYAECSNTVQGQAGTPVNNRSKLSKGEVLAYAAKITELAKWMADQGMPMAYHHHMGTIIETASIILIVVPLFLVVLDSFGVDLVWFGIITVVGAEIGLLTPPLGISCFVIKSTINDPSVSLADIFTGAFPFAVTMLIVLIILILYPFLSLALL